MLLPNAHLKEWVKINTNNLSLSFKYEKSTENNWIWKEKFYEASPEDLRKVLKLIERKIYSNEQF